MTALGLAALAFAAAAAEPRPTPDRTQPLLLPEPSFMQPTTAFVIKGSARTILVPVQWKDGEVERLPDAEASRIGRESLDRATTAMASQMLGSIQPTFHRDPKGVIEFAEMKSSSPLTVTVVFAPDLRKRFEETLGPELLVVIPNRFQVFLFPRHATNVQEFAPMIFDAYDATAYPVSPEVFEITDSGLKAFGVFERP